MLDTDKLNSIVTRVMAQLGEAESALAGATNPDGSAGAPVAATAAEAQDKQRPCGPRGIQSPVNPADFDDLVIDVPDPTEREARKHCGLVNASDEEGATNLIASTAARICVGRTGARPLTDTLLLFQADHGVAQDAIYGVVPDNILTDAELFEVDSAAPDREEYLVYPNQGRTLSDGGRKLIEEKCIKNPDVQIVVGDGLSVAAITNNLPNILPVLQQGLEASQLTMGTPFFVKNCRVGIMNDINSIIHAKVIVLLIGERPGLGIADAMSAYMGFDPVPGKSDADRDLICMITMNGGTNPLEAGAYIVDYVKRMIKYSASGVKLRELVNENGEEA